MNPDTRREVARKTLHMAMGGFAWTLHWLPPLQGALCALAALVHNLWLFPFYGYKKLLRPEEKAAGYSGMIGYPAVVLALCLLFPVRSGFDAAVSSGGSAPRVLWAAAGAWALLAFGDAFAALGGIFIQGPALPWNPRKRWSGLICFVAAGSFLAALTARFVAYGNLRFEGSELANIWVLCALAAVVASLVESLPGQIDDNLTVPLAAGLVLVMFARFDWRGFALRAMVDSSGGFDWKVFVLLLFNLGLGLTAWRLRWVTGVSAALGILWGTLVGLGSGWEGYGFLLLFYLLANGSTHVGKRVKSERGIAEADGGRRGVGSVFSKGLFPALFALVSPIALVGSLALYASDTVASEIGKLSKGTTWLMWARRRGKPGEAGGISLAGSLAGTAVAALFSLLFLAGCLLQKPSTGIGPTRFDVLFLVQDLTRLGLPAGAEVWLARAPLVAFALFLAVAACFFLESVLNETVVARGWYSKEIVHLLVGALAGVLPFVLFAAFTARHLLPAVWLIR